MNRKALLQCPPNIPLLGDTTDCKMGGFLLKASKLTSLCMTLQLRAGRVLAHAGCSRERLVGQLVGQEYLPAARSRPESPWLYAGK